MSESTTHTPAVNPRPADQPDLSHPDPMAVDLAPAGEDGWGQRGWEFRFVPDVTMQEVEQALDGAAECPPLADVARALDPEALCDEPADVQIARSLTLRDAAIVVRHRFPEAAAMMAGVIVQRLAQAGYHVARAGAWPSKPTDEARSDLQALLHQATSNVQGGGQNA